MRRVAAGLALIALGGCAGVQSALDPAGPTAERIALLNWVMTAGAALIFVGVMALVALAIFARRRAWLADRRVVFYGGVIFPVVVLTALLVFGLTTAGRLIQPREAPLRIEVIGEQFWWRVNYLGENGERVVSANEIRIPVRRPIEFILTTNDVIHSFWVPSLGGKLDMIPGHTNVLRLSASRPGTYRGQCAEYCGAQHAQMAFYVIAEEPAAFAAWLDRERQPVRPAVGSELERGAEVFRTAGCGSCHAVRGTDSVGALGPDLTHIGSRISIGAGMYPNNAGSLGGWIADSQHLKSGNRMPSFDALSGEDLRAVSLYLESLK